MITTGKNSKGGIEHPLVGGTIGIFGLFEVHWLLDLNWYTVEGIRFKVK
jgi:hypothetical protein